MAFLALAPALTSAIALPPPPPPPGWGMVTPFMANGLDEPVAFVAQRDGTGQILATVERDTVYSSYNITLRIRNEYGFSAYLHMSPLITYTGVYLAPTDQPDRMGVFATLASPGGAPRGVYLSFIEQDQWPASPTIVSDTASIQSVRLAATAQGDAMVVWMTYNGSYGLYANHSAYGAPFDGSVPLLTDASGIGDYQLAAVDNDTFVAAWLQYDGSMWHLWASRFTGSSGWSAPAEVAAAAPLIQAFSLSGSAPARRAALAYWAGDGTNATLSVVRLAGATWSSPEDVASVQGPRVNAYYPRVWVDEAGTTHLLWGEGPEISTARNLTYRASPASGGWSTAWTHTGSRIDYIQMTAAADGGAAITWSEAESTGHRRAHVARFVPGSGWRENFAFDVVYSPLHGAYGVAAVLGEGGNYTAVWQNMDNNVAELLFRDFTAGNDPPALSLTSPAGGSTTDTPTVLVEGSTAPGSMVVVDGALADVGPDGSFAVRVALEPGTHLIEVYAVDEWGNSARTTVTVTFIDPVPTLEAQLASAEANASAAAASALLAHEATHVVQQRADASDARASNLSAELNDTRAVVQHQQSDLDFLRAQAGTSANETKVAQSAAGTATGAAVAGAALGAAGLASSLLRRRGGGGGGGGGGGEMRTSGPAQQQQGAEPAGKGGPTQEPEPPPRPGAASGTGDTTGGIKQTMQQQV